MHWSVRQTKLFFFALLFTWLGTASAGLFDDEEARKAILDLRQKVEALRSEFDQKLSEEVKRSTDENALLRRSLVELQNQLELSRADVLGVRCCPGAHGCRCDSFAGARWTAAEARAAAADRAAMSCAVGAGMRCSIQTKPTSGSRKIVRPPSSWTCGVPRTLVIPTGLPVNSLVAKLPSVQRTRGSISRTCSNR